MGRSVLATAGQMIAAMAVAVVVSVVALIAISRVEWPAFPSSNQLHALTTVGQSILQLGERAAQMLLRRIAAPGTPIEQSVVAPSMVLRESTAAPSRAFDQFR